MLNILYSHGYLLEYNKNQLSETENNQIKMGRLENKGRY